MKGDCAGGHRKGVPNGRPLTIKTIEGYRVILVSFVFLIQQDEWPI